MAGNTREYDIATTPSSIAESVLEVIVLVVRRALNVALHLMLLQMSDLSRSSSSYSGHVIAKVIGHSLRDGRLLRDTQDGVRSWHDILLALMTAWMPSD